MRKSLRIIFGLFLLLALAIPSFAQGDARWKKNMLLIYVPEHQYASMMNEAFADWQGRLKQKIQFINSKFSRASGYKDDASLVDIDVKFSSVSGEGAENQGKTSLQQAQSGAIRKASIQIVLKDVSDLEQDALALAKNEEEIYCIMLQQVGKALGLSASSNEKSVMFDEIKEGQVILPEDIEQLYMLYHWPVYRPLKSK